MVPYMSMSLEEKLYLLHEMKERQEENFAHLQSIPSDCLNRKVQYERSFYKKKKKSHPFVKLFIVTLFTSVIIISTNGNSKNINIDSIAVYCNTVQNKLDTLSDKIKSIDLLSYNIINNY